jgi:phosphatidylethanolamine/phosphatidyl-N-methylethanolamine N-methyltransferase
MGIGHPSQGRLQHYDRLATVYDRVFGPGLQAGRAQSIRHLPIWPGDAVLEIGIGTGLTASLYPAHCSVTGIDVSAKMLARAARRIADRRLGHVRLAQMDAAALAFPDGTFALTYAAYVLTAVPHPVAVAREMRRVCKPGGYIVFLNHFLSEHPALSVCERAITPFAERIGFRTDLCLHSLLVDANLTPVRTERVNFLGLWSLVVCRKPL